MLKVKQFTRVELQCVSGVTILIYWNKVVGQQGDLDVKIISFIFSVKGEKLQ